MKGIILMGLRMVKELIYEMMDQNIMAHGKIIKLMDMEFILG